MQIGNKVFNNVSVTGEWTPGSGVSIKTPEDADLALSFTQTGHGVISGSGTFSVTAVPEPSTWAMMGLGFASLGFAAFRRGRPAIAIV